MPTGPPFRIDRQLCAFIGPVAEICAGTGALSDIEVRRRTQRRDPPMPAERQRRPLDPPAVQPVTEILVKPPEPIEVDRVFVHPHDLHG